MSIPLIFFDLKWGTADCSVRARQVAPDAQKPAVHEIRGASSPDRVVVDPTKGGAVEAKASQQSKALDVQPGTWIWGGLVKVLSRPLKPCLGGPTWCRHGPS